MIEAGRALSRAAGRLRLGCAEAQMQEKMQEKMQDSNSPEGP
jgi:hypothetical protein